MYITRPMAGGNAKNGITLSQILRQAAEGNAGNGGTSLAAFANELELNSEL
jgi:hypothetical protein